MQTHILQAGERKIVGRKVKVLRKEGLVPANIFGSKVKSMAIQVDQKEFSKVFAEAGETGIVELKIGKETRSTLVSNVQKDPVTDSYLHIDFKQVDLSQKVTANVPVEIVGEAPAEKQGLGTLIQQLDDVEVESLPADLPENIEVDVTKFVAVGNTIYVKDLKVSTKVAIKDDPEKIVVYIEEIKEEVIEEKPAPETAEVEAEETKKEEGGQEQTSEEAKKEK